MIKPCVKNIQGSLISRFDYNYFICNAFVYYWECDLFIVTKSGYGVEFEIKLSRSDFKKDFTKKMKHDTLSTGKCIKEFWGGEKKEITLDRPNRFYYVCPEGLIKPDEVPEYAGLIYFKMIYEYPCSSDVKIIKNSKFIHKEKINYENILCKKYFYLWLDSRRGKEI